MESRDAGEAALPGGVEIEAEGIGAGRACDELRRGLNLVVEGVRPDTVPTKVGLNCVEVGVSAVVDGQAPRTAEGGLGEGRDDEHAGQIGLSD